MVKYIKVLARADDSRGQRLRSGTSTQVPVEKIGLAWLHSVTSTQVPSEKIGLAFEGSIDLASKK